MEIQVHLPNMIKKKQKKAQPSVLKEKEKKNQESNCDHRIENQIKSNRIESRIRRIVTPLLYILLIFNVSSFFS